MILNMDDTVSKYVINIELYFDIDGYLKADPGRRIERIRVVLVQYESIGFDWLFMFTDPDRGTKNCCYIACLIYYSIASDRTADRLADGRLRLYNTAG